MQRPDVTDAPSPASHLRSLLTGLLLAGPLACHPAPPGAAATESGTTAGSDASAAETASAGPTSTTEIDAPTTTGATTSASASTGDDTGDLGARFVQIDPRDPRRLTWRGRPFFPVGYYAGAALNMTGPDFAGDYRGFQTALLDALAAGGVNYTRAWINWGNLGDDSAPLADQWDHHILHPYLRTGPGEAIDGEPRLDLDQFDPAYFTWLGEALDLAAARGIVVQVILLDCWHAGFGLQYGFGARDYFAAANNVNGLDFTSEDEWLDLAGPVFARHLAFVERAVEAAGDRDNVVWETCNEKRAGSHATPADTRMDAWHAALAAAIGAREAALGLPERRLVIPVDLPEHRTVAGHQTPDPQGGESIPDMRARLAGEQFEWATPLISDNDCCPGEPDAELVRAKAWAALSAGAHVDVFNNEMFKAAVLAAPHTAAGIRHVGSLGRFLADLEVDLAGMRPLPPPALGDAWVYGRAGEEYVLYLPQGGPVELPELGPVQARWWDPRNDLALDAGAGPLFTPPGPGDWALHLRSAP